MDELIEAAQQAREVAYAPYSEYTVGAAVSVIDGTIFAGSNIENANFSNSLHAEEVAIAKAITEEYRDLESLAVATESAAFPCGMCRQTISEFCDESFEIIAVGDDQINRATLGELLPSSFSKDMVIR